MRTFGFDLADKAMMNMGRRVDAATVVAMRATAKLVVAEGRSKARVYSGPRKDVPKERLKKSIKAGKTRQTPLGRAITVAPSGWPARGYAGKIEAVEPYMEPAEKKAEAEFGRICAEAWGKALL